MKKDSISEGKKAALARARQLTEFVWTPKRDVPVYTKQTGKTVLPGGEKVKGMLYSSTEPTDKFIAENISFETFCTIINNPDSALYNKDIAGHNNSWAYFGLVCNGLVRYALNIRRRYSTKRWLTVPGMQKIADDSKYTVDQIELCDILYAYGKGRNHVALVTDIICDEKGKVCQIEVSEAIRPTCVRRLYDVETFYEQFRLFALCRYDFIDSVPSPSDECCQFVPKELVPSLPDIALDYGNKTNYRSYEDIVISVFREGENEIEIFRGDTLIETITISGRGKTSRKFERGYYTARLTSTGEVVAFCVNEPKITHTTENGILRVHADAGDAESEILYMEFREKTNRNASDKKGKDAENADAIYYSPNCSPLSKVEELTRAEKETGVIVREIPEDAGNFKIYFENKYGIWTHTMIEI